MTNTWIIRIVLWQGTQQTEHYAESYDQAMAIVDKFHRNAFDPQFFDREGNELVDCGAGFCTEAEAAKPNPILTA
jgi:hypothetical protein